MGGGGGERKGVREGEHQIPRFLVGQTEKRDYRQVISYVSYITYHDAVRLRGKGDLHASCI